MGAVSRTSMVPCVARPPQGAPTGHVASPLPSEEALAPTPAGTPSADDVPDGMSPVAPAQAGELLVVGTPIGNPDDISLRALRVLREVDLIAAEDTRVTRRLLRHHGVTTPTTSYSQHSQGSKARYLADLLSKGMRIALVSDAGMPGIADPGHELVELALRAGVRVTPVPGPTAAIAAVAVSGLRPYRFAFDGFPPRQRKNRLEFFRRLTYEERTIILYESPRRVREALRDLLSVLGDRQAVLALELTKPSERIQRGSLESLYAYATRHKIRGEAVIIVEGRDTNASPPEEVIWPIRSQPCP